MVRGVVPVAEQKNPHHYRVRGQRLCKVILRREEAFRAWLAVPLYKQIAQVRVALSLFEVVEVGGGLNRLDEARLLFVLCLCFMHVWEREGEGEGEMV